MRVARQAGRKQAAKEAIVHHRECCLKTPVDRGTYLIKQVAHQTREHDRRDGANGDA